MYRHILICWLLLTPFTVLNAQMLHNPVPPSYNSDMRRLLLVGASTYIYGIGQGQLDLDSAVLYTAAIFNLSRLLPYNEGYNTGKDYPGMSLIDAGRISEARQLLPGLKGIPRLQLLSELSIYYLHQPGTNKADLAEAGKYTALLHEESGKAGDNFWLLQSNWLLGAYYAQTGDMAQSERYFSEGTALCRKTGNVQLLARSLLYHANVLPIGNPEKEQYYQEALSITQKHTLPMLRRTIMTFSILEHLRTAPLTVEKELMEALALEKQIGYQHLQYTYSVLGYVYTMHGDAVTTVKYAELAVKSMEATKDTALSSNICMRIAQIYNNMDDREKATYWLNRALSIPLTRETQVIWYKSFLEKISLIRRLNRPAEALQLIQTFNRQSPPESDFNKMMLEYQTGAVYSELGNDKSALEHYLAFINIAQRFPPQFTYTEILTAYNEVATFYFSKGDYSLARKYTSYSLDHPIGKVSPADLARTYKLLYKLDSAAGNYARAVENLQRYHAYSDSVYSYNQRKAIAEITIRYETEKKDQDIRILKQDSQLQKARLSRSSMIGRITLGGVVLLLIIVLLLYSQYRIKRKASQDALSRNLILQQLLEEKEWLLREVHHRVKNNLQTIVSLLESQSAYLENEALLAIQESQNRIHAMSLIHQKLYNNENMSSVNMGTYLPELVYYLRQSYNVKSNIIFNVQADDVELDVSQAIPLGLIVNEAVTNAIKYAFPKPGPGKSISISLLIAGTQAKLRITDNGIGITPEKLQAKVRGLGLQLIRGLAKDIDGELALHGDNGTTIVITFEVSLPLTNTANTLAETTIS